MLLRPWQVRDCLWMKTKFVLNVNEMLLEKLQKVMVNQLKRNDLALNCVI